MSNRRHAKRCLPRNHQTIGESALYNYMYGASRKTGIFYSDDRRDCKQFESTKDPKNHVSKNTLTKYRHGLERKGWIERVGGGQRNPITGMYASIEYRVLTHDEWVAKYPDRCPAHGSESQTPEPQVCVEDSEDIRSQSQGQAPVPIQSQTTCTTSPKQRVPPVPNFGAKKVVREKGEREANALSRSDSKDLLDIVVTAAIETNAAAIFTKKSYGAITTVIEEMNATPDELSFTVKSIVIGMDKFELHHAGQHIAANLKGQLAVYRKRVEEQAQREGEARLKAEQKAEAESKAKEWRDKFAGALQAIGHDPGSDPWVADAKLWVENNAPPAGLEHWPSQRISKAVSERDNPYCECKDCIPWEPEPVEQSVQPEPDSVF